MSERQPEPLHAFKFERAEIRPLTAYSELQKAIMPVVGLADGTLKPFATCFRISRSLPIVITAWHVVSEFIEANGACLRDGSCHLAVIYETDARIPGTDLDLGGPLPVFQVAHQEQSDLALMTLWDVTSNDTKVAPAAVAPISFRVPPMGDHCYGFGYPQLKGGDLVLEGGRRVVDFERTLHCTAGRVIDVFPEGQPGHAMVEGPSLHCDSPAPFGMSGGPVYTDQACICGAFSSAIAPFQSDDPWTSYVTLLQPMLDFELTLQDPSGAEHSATVRELIENGDIEIEGAIPLRSHGEPQQETKTLTFGRPRLE
jgi:Trypsin-like peptidase domain